MFPSRRNLVAYPTPQRHPPHPRLTAVLDIVHNERQFNKSDIPVSPLLQYLRVFPRHFHLKVPSQRHPSCIGQLLRILRLELGQAGVNHHDLFSSSTASLEVIHSYFPSKQHPSRVGRLLRAWWLGIAPDWAMGTQDIGLGRQAEISDSDSIWDGMQRTLRVMLDL